MRVVAIISISLLFAAASVFAQCPVITVRGPAGITNPGDKMAFRVEVNVVGPQFKYNWTVSAGAIAEGHGTPSISIVTDKSMAGGNVTATVEVEGLPSGCEKSASEVAGVVQPPPVCWVSDSWEQLRPNDERGRIDAFFAELMNNPTDIGLFVLRVRHDEKLDARNRRIQFILKHAKFRKFDHRRLWFALELSETRQTSITRISPDGELPCTECLIIKGGELQ